MTDALQRSEALARCIRALSEQAGVIIEGEPGERQATVTYRDMQIVFTPSQTEHSNLTPASIISALWARTASTVHGYELHFFKAFGFLPDDASSYDVASVSREAREFYNEWRRCGEWSIRAFGDWFGKTPKDFS